MKTKAVLFVFLNEILLGGGLFFGPGQVLAQNWQPFGGALGGSPNPPALVSAVAAWGTNVYVGGDFTLAGGVSARRIARWDGFHWSALGTGSSNGFDAPVLAVAVSPAGALYAGGTFSMAGGRSANCIARWDGTNWFAVGAGVTSDGWIDAIAFTPNGDLYAGGTFSSIGGVSVHSIARWDGTNWSDVGGGLTRSPSSAVIKAILAVGNQVYVGGAFSMAGATPANALARWDGSTWTAVDGGVSFPGFNAAVYSLAFDGTNLFVGGDFTLAGSVNAAHIARWDGQNWFPLGLGANSTVRSIFVLDHELFAGGNFTMVGGQALSGLARWLGDRWWSVGSGLSGPQPMVNQMAAAQGGLFVAGSFTGAGGQASTSFARWSLTNDLPLVEITAPTNHSEFTAGDTVVITVDAASPNGALTNVEFFAGASSLGTLTNGPFNFSWTNTAAGTQALTVRATDETGASQTSAAITIIIDPFIPGPKITQQPQGQKLTNGASATLTVIATGKGTVTYQWFKDGTVLGGATNASLTITNAQLGDSAVYTVQLTDPTGVVTSAPAIISVLQPVVSVWTQAVGPNAHSSPAIGEGGIVYIGNDISGLYAVGPNGVFQWRFATSNYVQSSPAIAADGTIYFGSHDHNVYAVTPDGTGQWAFTTGYPVFGSPAIGADGTIYAGSSDMNFYALDPAGNLKWLFHTQGEILSAPAIGADGTIYAASADGNLYALTPDGTNTWKFPTGGLQFNSPIIGGDGTIYIASTDTKLYAVNPDGSKKWEFKGLGPFNSSPVIGPDGTIYIGNDGIFDPAKGTLRGRFYAISAAGTEKWEFITGDAIRSCPAVSADGTIYFGADDLKFYALNPNGTERWEFYVGFKAESGPAIRFDGVVYFGAGDGLHALQGSSPLADTPWPMFLHDLRHTGNAATPRTPDVWYYPFSSNAFDDPVNAVGASGRDIYVGGDFQIAGGVGAKFIARWDGTNWWPVGAGLNGPVWAMAINGTNVYVGGGFTSAGGTSANRVALWDGSQWHALGAGLPEDVFALAVSGSNLYAGGAFATNGVPANSVNAWDGSQWSTVGGLGGTVLALAADGTNLCAGGINLGGGNIQRWDGSQWSAFASVNGTVRAIAASNGVVYLGGDFSTVNAQRVNGVAEWNGTNWLSLAGGVGDPVLPYVDALTIDGTNLYAGGSFTTAGGASANRIARWDGANWNALGSGLAGSALGSAATVNSIALLDGEVFAGGAFMSAGGDRNIHHFARWDGTNWSALGPLLGFVNGAFQFLLTDQIGRTYGIEASPDLVKWTRVITFTNLGGLTQFRDEAGTNLNRRFYRTVTP